MDSTSSFLSGVDPIFVADLYARFLRDPNTVEGSWRSLFQSLGDDERSVLADLNGPSWTPPKPKEAPEAPTGSGAKGAKPNGKASNAETVAAGVTPEEIKRSLKAWLLIRAYRVRGHLLCTLDPLGIEKPKMNPDLDPATYGFTDADLDRPIYIADILSLGTESPTLRQILERLRRTYSGHVGVEYMHIQDPDQRLWIQQRIEAVDNETEFTREGKRAILERITAAETFERFLGTKYVGTKRFGLDGGEALVPLIEQVMKRGGQLGVKEIVVGMAHRGRLNVLTNVMLKPFHALFSEFQGNSAKPEDVQGSGDVKYHLGTSADRDFDGNTIHLSLTPNPSHLEVVNPVVLGKVRAKQMQLGDTEREQVLPVLLHGDAAFAGQGVVAESMMLSELKGYRVGGCVHIIVNNQIGFTTTPSYSRSGPYCTDVAKMVQAPIFHVNGDDPEAVVHVARIATEFRQRFKKDVVLDMFCYRRFGHNEGDEPAFTQPVMYRLIKDHPTTREIYAKRLEAEGLLTAGEADKLVADFQAKLEAEFETATSYKPNKADWLEGAWTGLETAKPGDRRGETSVSTDVLKKIGAAISSVPNGFAVNPKIARQLQAKAKMFETGEGIDWATGEALAFGSLVLEDVPVRLSGQDAGRGTFSQRHAVLHDQENEQRYIALQHLDPSQAQFEVHDSPLSELAVVGFEYGISLAEPKALVAWEAQFGDFANMAQPIFDQFVSSGESKWLRMSGLVLLLPHGYEGQGPEHSSARLERFLQMSGEDNWQVVNCTTPANYFHVLRRQIRRTFRKPLVVMTPKSLLRHKLAVSPLKDFAEGSSFHRVLPETASLDGKKVRRVVLCSGKVYYDLLADREARKLNDVAIVRLEQLYPYPEEPLMDELKKYPNADVVWCQEEPENQGAWYWIDRRLERTLEKLGGKAKRPAYAGRAEAAATATGLLKKHNLEQAALLEAALVGK
ncbi:2-oxoglutarate dehydrogenase E1 component [Roseiterribacter gracilis]|uniref:2-oxoglutarate dehydrogenase E1 component n=1 Tax=Roseiterribacter gracilis TaxID=2812848 RepID=A0A8S8XCK7_9PROT|nr:2-oxoglutarate dehydrogenase subunit E1 [Rhodospirillales bacterium TMPK1]